MARAREEAAKPKASRSKPRVQAQGTRSAAGTPKAAQPQNGNGKGGARVARVKTPNWPAAVQHIIEQTGDYYLGDDGKPNFYHLVGAAAKCGHSEITDANIRDVIGDLIDYARVARDAQGQKVEEGNDDLPF